jgi:hypothetical protein
MPHYGHILILAKLFREIRIESEHPQTEDQLVLNLEAHATSQSVDYSVTSIQQ